MASEEAGAKGTVTDNAVTKECVLVEVGGVFVEWTLGAVGRHSGQAKGDTHICLLCAGKHGGFYSLALFLPFPDLCCEDIVPGGSGLHLFKAGAQVSGCHI